MNNDKASIQIISEVLNKLQHLKELYKENILSADELLAQGKFDRGSIPNGQQQK